MDNWLFKENSLDLIRLIVSIRVATLHTFEYIVPALYGYWLLDVLRLFPGVPIFYFLSGLLISKTYERTPELRIYGRNRFLRIYPALFVCVLGNILLVGSTGYFKEVNASLGDISLLFLAKTTVLQFYNPDFMRSFGDGVLNGSLWTICVEIQFYLIVPILYRFFSKNFRFKQLVLLSLIAIFIIVNRSLFYLQGEYGETILWKLYRVSLFPWFYMFLLGIYIQQNFNVIAGFLQRIPIFVSIIGYAFFATWLSRKGFGLGNSISPILYIPMIAILLQVAYLHKGRYGKVLKGNDYSYGLYLWHMVIVNQFLYLGWAGSTIYAAIALLISFSLAALTWFYITKPALSMRKRPQKSETAW